MAPKTDPADKWAIASLRVFSDRDDVEEVTTLLQRAPTKSYKRSGHTESLWLLESDVDEVRRDLPKQLSWLLDFVESRHGALQAPTVSLVDLCCAVSSASGQFAFLLDRRLLERLGRAGFRSEDGSVSA